MNSASVNMDLQLSLWYIYLDIFYNIKILNNDKSHFLVHRYETNSIIPRKVFYTEENDAVVCMCVCHMNVWRSEDNFGCQSLFLPCLRSSIILFFTTVHP